MDRNEKMDLFFQIQKKNEDLINLRLTDPILADYFHSPLMISSANYSRNIYTHSRIDRYTFLRFLQ